MCQVRTYKGHVTYVNQIEMDNKYLFTTGINDQCVFQWGLHESKKEFDLDFMNYDTKKSDVFLAEIENREKYTSIVDELLTLRDEIVHMKEKIDETIEPEIFLELHAVIGRRAYNRRNNLLLTLNNKLMFNTGSIIVSLNIPMFAASDVVTQDMMISEMQQSFLEPDKENIFSISPEVTAIAICERRKYLCVGTSQNNAKILIWEVTSKTFIRSMTLNGYCTVLIIEFAYDSRTIACTALSRDYTQCVFLIDSETSQILAAVNHLYSIPFKIKDIIFKPNSRNEFFTCGIQHLTLWSYRGEVLNCQEIELVAPKQLNKESKNNMNDQDNDSIEDEDGTFKVSFLAMIFIRDRMIIGAEDGFVDSPHPDLPAAGREVQVERAGLREGAHPLPRLRPVAAHLHRLARPRLARVHGHERKPGLLLRVRRAERLHHRLEVLLLRQGQQQQQTY